MPSPEFTLDLQICSEMQVKDLQWGGAHQQGIVMDRWHVGGWGENPQTCRVRWHSSGQPGIRHFLSKVIWKGNLGLCFRNILSAP